MASGSSNPRRQKLAKAALAKSNTIQLDFGDINNTTTSKLNSLSQSLEVTYDGNYNVSSNGTTDKLNRVLITTVTVSTVLTTEGMTLVDCTSGDINITLPNPANMLVNGRSNKIDISKIDSTSNIVNILPYASELIVGEAAQDLQVQGEVLNFVTDGTNWYLGS